MYPKAPLAHAWQHAIGPGSCFSNGEWARNFHSVGDFACPEFGRIRSRIVEQSFPGGYTEQVSSKCKPTAQIEALNGMVSEDSHVPTFRAWE
jgi:hypothetical protein